MTPHVGIAPYPTYVLARNISACSFDTSGDSITLTLTVSIDNHSTTLSGSAVHRGLKAR